MSEPFTLSQLKKLLATPQPPELGPGPRARVMPLAELQAEIDRALEAGKLPSVTGRLIRATILLWHDHLDTAHALAQEIESADGSYVHAIMHRREPDYGNAKYWFRRVGAHACFPELAAKTAALLQIQDPAGLAMKLAVEHSRWDPYDFIDECEAAAGQAESTPRTELLRAIQKIEFEVLLEHVYRLEQ